MSFFIRISFSCLVLAGSMGVHAALPVWHKNLFAVPVTTAPTPDLTRAQFYLQPAPRGVGAVDAWNLPGGRGQNVKVIDIEVSYENRHEDLGEPFYLGANPQAETHHGTAVLGVIRGLGNEFGMTGIAPDARMGFFGFIEGEQGDVDRKYIEGINRAIRESAARLEPGDVLVMEQHMYGPDGNRFTAVEYWPEIFAELKKVTDKGIHCVQAAGNGGSNFDAPVYQGAFDLSKRDSGCIIVGAGNPGNHERLFFSNYGSRIDAFGYGEGVATMGYGDLFNGGVTRQYTEAFSGTSSATPVVAGAVAVVSSIAKAQGRLITPREMRDALRRTGTPQGPRTRGSRIGNLPNIAEMLRVLGL